MRTAFASRALNDGPLVGNMDGRGIPKGGGEVALPEVAVLSLGGTISSTDMGDGDGVAPSLSGEDLVEDVPEIAEVAEVSAESFRQVASPELTVDDLVELAGEIERRVDGGANGVVVTQGTDTIEETVFALDLLTAVEAPVVVTGAMRNPTLPGADGPANLLAAVRVAASPEVRGLGALVVFNDEIHAARYVRKTHTTSTATFRSPLTGPLGWLVEDRVRIAVRVSRLRHIRLDEGSQRADVALLVTSLGDDGRLVPQVKQLGYAGLVMEAFGGGHVPPQVADRLGELAAEMPVVLASRTGSGDMLRHTYGFKGSESDLLSRGLISANWLDGPKARIFLLLLLRADASREEIAAAFAEL